MIVNLDSIIFSLQSAGGISAYWSELTQRALISKEIEFNFFGCKSNNLFAKNLSNYSAIKESRINCKVLRYLPFLRKLKKNSIFHSSYYRTSRQSNIANVTTVHDFTYEYYMSGLQRSVHSYQKRKAIGNSAGIICVSDNTKKDLLKFNPDVDPSNVRVIYNGVSDCFKPLCSAGSDFTIYDSMLWYGRFVLFVGDRSAYKNFDKAVIAVLQFTELQLVIIGGADLTLDEKVLISKLEGRVLHLRGISAIELNFIYNNALCLLYPSDYEGFGIPILEAMKAGCPVVSTNRSSIPEVAGDAALLVEETDALSFAEQIDKLRSLQLRDHLIQKGLQQASKFSWDKCFAQTTLFYKEIYNQKFG